MPSYEICYLNSDGSLACTLAANCADDMHAKVLAHAMKLGEYKRFEVWTGRTLIYERPMHFEAGHFEPSDANFAGAS